ncbi:MAG: hypothetical protein JW841_01810 [Deltaproteobacteria bacterium]|nr:hypothetical protein [Deltaproteobacteria bacterium]
MGPKRLQQLINCLKSENESIRAETADELTDVSKALDSNEVSQLAQVLVETLLNETAIEAQEAQLNALCDIKAWHSIDKAILAHLHNIPYLLPNTNHPRKSVLVNGDPADTMFFDTSEIRWHQRRSPGSTMDIEYHHVALGITIFAIGEILPAFKRKSFNLRQVGRATDDAA